MKVNIREVARSMALSHAGCWGDYLPPCFLPRGRSMFLWICVSLLHLLWASYKADARETITKMENGEGIDDQWWSVSEGWLNDCKVHGWLVSEDWLNYCKVQVAAEVIFPLERFLNVGSESLLLRRERPSNHENSPGLPGSPVPCPSLGCLSLLLLQSFLILCPSTDSTQMSRCSQLQ